MSKIAEPETIVAANLSLGWASVLDRLARPGVDSISPLSLSITGFGDGDTPAEVPAIRGAVDTLLAAKGKRDVENVAWTIFPQRYWLMAGIAQPSSRCSAKRSRAFKNSTGGGF